MINTGIIGLSEGNGHPFSFSAIINGYDKIELKKSGWKVIYDYLQTKKKHQFGIKDVRITHAWTQSKEITQQLCKACLIKNHCSSIDEMYKNVDAVIIARDDWKQHLNLALPFLKMNIPVFIDKPMTLDTNQLKIFRGYVLKNKLMSCSGFRFSTELDSLRKLNFNQDKLMFNGTVINDLDKYGIHILDAIAGIGISFKNIIQITRINSIFENYYILLKNNVEVNLTCLGKFTKTFHVSIFTKKFHKHFNLNDNFGAFRRTLINFFNMIKYDTLNFDPLETMYLMELIINLKKLKKGESLTFQ